VQDDFEVDVDDNNNSNNIDGYDFKDEEDGSFNWSVDETFDLLDTYRELKPQFDEPYSKKTRLWKKVRLFVNVTVI